jgi:hypothetical protein
MWILGLEAGAALLLLVFIVWWTMFAGRAPEQPARPRQAARPPAQAHDAASAARAQGEHDDPGSRPADSGPV